MSASREALENALFDLQCQLKCWAREIEACKNEYASIEAEIADVKTTLDALSARLR